MHKDRLLMLATLLREDAANAKGAMFDLGTWASPSDNISQGYDSRALGLDPDQCQMYGPPQNRIIGDDKLPKVSCGTTACALGLAMLSKRFEQFGLRGSYFVNSMHGGQISIALVPVCNGEDGFEAGAQLFDISNADSRYLFDPDCYDGTPKEKEGELLVAERIEAFADGDVEDGYHPDTKNEDDDED